jgi:hypothetical protein
MIHPRLEMRSPPNQSAYIYTTVHTSFVCEKSAGSDFGPNFPGRLAPQNRRGLDRIKSGLDHDPS